MKKSKSEIDLESIRCCRRTLSLFMEVAMYIYKVRIRAGREQCVILTSRNHPKVINFTVAIWTAVRERRIFFWFCVTARASPDIADRHVRRPTAQNWEREPYFMRLVYIGDRLWIFSIRRFASVETFFTHLKLKICY